MYLQSLKLNELDLTKPIFFDTETIGLYGRTRLVQLRQNDISLVFDCFYVNIEDLKYQLKNCHLIGHNIHYDLSCKDFRRWIPSKIDDTLLLAKAQFPTLESFSLKSLVDFLELSEHKGDEGASDWSQYALTENQLNYAELDTFFVQEIWSRIDEEIKNSNYYKLDILNVRYALEYQNKGMPLDSKNINRFKRELTKKLKTFTLPEDLNINSPKQVRDFLNVPSSDKNYLLNLNNEKANEILEKRQTMKALSYLEDFKPHKFLYSFIVPGGAKTGRFTSKGSDLFEDSAYVNLQQIPRDMKSIFKVNAPAQFVTADYPALEIWMAGAIINDEFMVNVLKNKEDLHYSAAEKMFQKERKDISKLERRVAKMCNFTLMYGAGYNTLGQAMINDGFPEVAHRAKEFREQWHKTYIQISNEINKAYDYFSNHSYKICYTPLGRPMCARSPMELLNFAIQGGGAECTKLALHLLSKEKVNIVNTVHDSIALIAYNEKQKEEYAQILKWAMEEAYIRVIRNLPAHDLRLEVTVDIGEEYE